MAGGKINSASMGKKPGFTKAELEYLSGIDEKQLNDLIYQVRGVDTGAAGTNEGQSQRPSGMPQETIQTQPAPIDTASVSAAITPENASKELDALFSKYIDPATLEQRPEWANGSSPQRPIMQSPSGDAWERIKLSFGNLGPEQTAKRLKGLYGAENVVVSKTGKFNIKQDGIWKRFDPEGMGSGDAYDKAIELTKDILADNANLFTGIGAGVAAAAAAPVVALGAAATGVGGTLAGAATTGAASGFVSSAVPVVLGRLAGTFEATPEEMLKQVGLETVFSTFGNTILPGMKLTKDAIANSFAKGAVTNLAKEVPEQQMGGLIKISSFLTGENPGIVSEWYLNPQGVAKQVSKYGTDVNRVIKDGITDAIGMSKEIVKARNNYGKQLYGDVVKEAGNNFKPNFFKSASEAAMPLVDQGVLAVRNGKFIVNPEQIINQANKGAVNVFENAVDRRALQDFINYTNKWASKSPASGTEGMEQFIAMKRGLNDVVRSIRDTAREKGISAQAISKIDELSNTIKTTYLNNSVDKTKAPALFEKLMAADKQYGELKKTIGKFEKIAATAKSIDDTGAQSFYKDIVNSGGLTIKKGASRSQLDATIDLLGDLNPKIGELRDSIMSREAAIRSQAIVRPGLISQGAAVGTVTGAIAGGVGGAVPFATAAVAMSPRINYETAKIASSFSKGLSFLKTLPPKMRVDLIKTPEAFNKWVSTMTNTPGLEGQISQQLGSILTGNGQGENGPK